MEFDHVGQHCEVAECRQRDFLPYICEICKGSYCSEHRTYISHGCSGAFSKDMTSIDCPVCKKSIRLSKADSADEMWMKHYNTECTQNKDIRSNKSNSSTSAPSSNKKKCARGDCRVVLGPSNTMSCTQCLQTVCLTHRLPEEHTCRTYLAGSSGHKGNTSSGASIQQKRDALLRSAQVSSSSKPSLKTTNSGSSKPQNQSVLTFGTNNINRTGGSKNSKTQVQAQPDSIYSTVGRRAQNHPSRAGTGSQGIAGSNASSNISTSTIGSNTSTPSTTSISGGRREEYRCPICQPVTSFSDPVLLVTHMDAGVHNQAQGSSSQTNHTANPNPSISSIPPTDTGGNEVSFVFTMETILDAHTMSLYVYSYILIELFILWYMIGMSTLYSEI